RAPPERMFAIFRAETCRRSVAASIPDTAMDWTLLMNRPKPADWPNPSPRPSKLPAGTPSNSGPAVYVQFITGCGPATRPGSDLARTQRKTRPKNTTTTNERRAYIRRHLTKRGRLGDGTLYTATTCN